MTRRRTFEWQYELDLAKSTLADEPGEVVIATDAFVAFRYIEPGVRLVFYPHKVRTGNRHLRIRIEPCKDKERAVMLQRKLDNAAGFNCTFHRKNHFSAGN